PPLFPYTTLFRSWLSCALLQVGVHDLPVASDERALDDLVVPIHLDRPFLLVDHQLEESIQIAGIKARGVDGHLAGEIERAGNPDAIHLDDLARLRQLAVAAALGREVDDDRARLHALDHRGGD